MTGSKEDRASLAQAVGEAIGNWAQVEQGLCVVFSLCSMPFAIDPQTGMQALFQHKHAVEMFYAVDNFRAKLALVDAVIRVSLTDQEQATRSAVSAWEKILEKSRKVSTKRNKLAHWIPFTINIDTDTTKTVLISPSDYGMMTTPNEQDQITIKQIGDLKTSMTTLQASIHSLQLELAMLPVLLRRPLELSNDLKALYDRIGQNHLTRSEH